MLKIGLMVKSVEFEPYIETARGKKFRFLDPRPEDIDIIDIAHALSNICRFTGHTKRFYCVSPETLVLTKDLDWVRADTLVLDQEIYSLEEEAQDRADGKRKRKKLLPATVKHTGIIYRETYKLTLENGDTLTASSEHPWLVATKQAGNQKWMSCKEIEKQLIKGNSIYLPKFFNVWEQDNSRDAGWLAGIYDGEGHISKSSNQIGVAQKEGVVLEKIKSLLAQYVHFTIKENDKKLSNLYVRGSWEKRFEFLGTLKPQRLINNLWRNIKNTPIAPDAFQKVKVISIENLGVGPVVALETSTHTYFANGYAAHNSVAQHSIHVASLLPPQLQMWGLLHDASEAYIADLASPIKPYLQSYKDLELGIMNAIARRFGLPEGFHKNLQVVHADLQMLKKEAFELMPSKGSDWVAKVHEVSMPDVRLPVMSPFTAKSEFLLAFGLLQLKDG